MGDALTPTYFFVAVVKRNKTQFLYLLFRQCPRDDNETCSPVDTVYDRISLAIHKKHSHVRSTCIQDSSIVPHTRARSVHSYKGLHKILASDRTFDSQFEL